MHVGNLIDERLAFRIRQFIGMGNGLCGSATVLAGQVTGLRDLPDGQKRSFVKVEPAASGNIVHRLHATSCGIGAARTGFRLDSKSKGPRARGRSGFRNWRKTALWRHDSGLEEQVKRGSDCDSDHFASQCGRGFEIGRVSRNGNSDAHFGPGFTIAVRNGSIVAVTEQPVLRRECDRNRVS